MRAQIDDLCRPGGCRTHGRGSIDDRGCVSGASFNRPAVIKLLRQLAAGSERGESGSTVERDEIRVRTVFALRFGHGSRTTATVVPPARDGNRFGWLCARICPMPQASPLALS